MRIINSCNELFPQLHRKPNFQQFTMKQFFDMRAVHSWTLREISTRNKTFSDTFGVWWGRRIFIIDLEWRPCACSLNWRKTYRGKAFYERVQVLSPPALVTVFIAIFELRQQTRRESSVGVAWSNLNLLPVSKPRNRLANILLLIRPKPTSSEHESEHFHLVYVVQKALPDSFLCDCLLLKEKKTRRRDSLFRLMA